MKDVGSPHRVVINKPMAPTMPKTIPKMSPVSRPCDLEPVPVPMLMVLVLVLEPLDALEAVVVGVDFVVEGC